jgi:hypothetical protein
MTVPPSDDRLGLRPNRLYGRWIDKSAEAHRNAVPAVDDIDQQCELDLLLLGEVSVQGLIGTFVLVSFGKPSQCLGPAERGTLFAGRPAGGKVPGLRANFFALIN